MRRFGKQPFAWNENVKFLNKSIKADETHDEIRHEDSDNGHQNETNVKSIAPQTCRNSVQGKILIADDRGK